MKGIVDGQLRALLRLPVSASRAGERTDLVVWIDTAFNGGLTSDDLPVYRGEAALVQAPLHRGGSWGPVSVPRGQHQRCGSLCPGREEADLVNVLHEFALCCAEKGLFLNKTKSLA